MDWLSVAAIMTTVLGIATIMGLVIRFGVIPYIGDTQVDPIAKLLNEVREELKGEVREAKAEVVALSRMFDGHLEWSQSEVDKMWNAIYAGRNLPRQKRG